MSSTPDQHELEHLQHEAEHVRPARKANVMTYLVVLFGAAFLLMLLTYFMQQRTNEQTIDSLKESMTTITAMKSLEELQSDNASLQKALDLAQASVKALETQVTTLQQDSTRQKTEVATLQAHADALKALNQIRALYNQRMPGAAREAVSAAAEALSAFGGLEPVLTTISADMTPETRDVYDPLEAYHTISEWLNK